MSTTARPEDLYAMLQRSGAHRQFTAGEVIFEQGDRGDAMYLVSSGSVALKAGDHVVETVVAPGLFGEMALIEQEPRALTAIADCDAELIEVPARHFWVLVHETPHFAQLVMSVMAQRLRRLGTTT